MRDLRDVQAEEIHALKGKLAAANAEIERLHTEFMGALGRSEAKTEEIQQLRHDLERAMANHNADLNACTPSESGRGEAWKPGEPRVVCAAIRDKLGRIVTGARHFDEVMIAQIRRTVPDQDAFRTAEQGFIDQFGNFLTREEAMVLATKWGQIIRDDEGRQSLYSENLY